MREDEIINQTRLKRALETTGIDESTSAAWQKRTHASSIIDIDAVADATRRPRAQIDRVDRITSRQSCFGTELISLSDAYHKKRHTTRHNITLHTRT